MQISISIRQIVGIMVVFALVLVPLNYLLRYVEQLDSYPDMDPERFFYLLDVDGEMTIPTWYSSFQFLFAGGLLWIAAVVNRERRFHRHWAVLGWLFLLLSIDEMSSIHERFMGPMRGALYKFGLYNSFFYFAWVVPAAIFLVLLGIVYFRFLRALPPRTFRIFLIAGVVFVAGAIGLEMIGANFVYYEGITDRTFRMLQPLEELGEMLGLTIFIYGLLDYLRSHSEDMLVKLI